MKDEFSRYHPIANFAYFAAAIAFSMVYMHPLFLIISNLAALSYLIYLNGKKAFGYLFKFVAPTAALAVLVNFLFNHRGGTILFYMYGGNPATLESLIYGISAAAMFASVLLWFACLNRVFTTDKFIYLFGRIIPSLSLILSMILRFVPLFKRRYTQVSEAQKGLYSKTDSGKRGKARRAFNTLSIMLTWSLENAVGVADSMRARGYGLRGRTAFTTFRMYFRDTLSVVATMCASALLITLGVFGAVSVEFYPRFEYSESIFTALGGILYAVLCLTPLAINLTGDLRWKYSESKN